MDIKKHWERTAFYFDMDPVPVQEAADVGKCGIRVVDKMNSLEVSFIWLKTIVTASLLLGCARKTIFLLHVLEMVGLQTAVASSRISSA